MMVSHVTNLPSAGSLEYMNMYLETSGALVGSSRFTKRSGCGYEYISQGFRCPGAAFGVVVSWVSNACSLENQCK